MRPLLAGVAVAAGVLAAPGLAAAAPLLDGPPRIGAVALSHDGGGVVLDVPVRTPSLTGAARGRVHPDAAAHIGLVRVRVRGAGGAVTAVAGTRSGLLLRASGGRARHVFRARLGGSAAARVRRAAGLGGGRIEVLAVSRLTRDGERRPREVVSSRRMLALAGPASWSGRPPALRAPVCERTRSRATRGTVTRIAVRCAGATHLALRSGPVRGTARMVRVDEGRAVIDYRAPSRGRDRLILTARGPGGRTAVSRPLAVRAPVMRALGDSVTAGFGFLPNGDSMSILQLPSCIPPDVQNDRCSSNSANGPGTAGPPRYLPDWGLSNGIAWPAQFARANGLSAGTSFQNLAVSGSTPGNWDTGGALNPTLAGIVADQPDLTVMTLGANPLLDSFLFGGGLRCELTLSEAAFTACVEGFIERSDLVARVRSVIAQLLESPTNHVVVSHYHQAIPSSSVFGVPSLRIMSGLLNDAVSEAATGSPEFGERVFLMSPPLFPVGVGPGDAVCTTKSLSGLVDGESRQSRPTQDELEVVRLGDVCDTDVYWIISGDTGIHPSRLGHAQFAAALTRVVEANDLLGAGPAG